MHPSGLVCLLFAVALIALALVARGRRSVGFVLLGATVAALVLTEVNAGAFAVIAMLFTGVILAPPLRRIRVPRALTAVLFVATPFLLVWDVGGDFTQSWATMSTLVALTAAAVVALTLDSDLQGLVQSRDAYRFLIGGGILSTVVILIALLSGARPVDLIRGVFISPASLPNVFTVPIHLPVWVELWGAACLVGAIWYRRYRHRSSCVGLGHACAHLIVGALVLYCALDQAQIRNPGTFAVNFIIALPPLFFVAIPPHGATESERIARVGVVALAVLESLLAYPVAASQTFWAALLIVPAGVLCLHDGVRQLRPALAATRRTGS